ncbi:unnamed protein product [Cylicocyclus nassatus]|uniref:Uncharacterized protein n=1 Tax=Cylicocyclus nassatus TaxID=53992 RepID=A0AA36HF55_CYLNA|nr:unnamed protein product [Cylicocyclus nassatus]
MNHRAVVPFLLFLFLLAFVSAALLDALRYAHCESPSSFSQLYFPLFLVNNVFVTLAALVFWILSERKAPMTVNRRLATSWITDSSVNSHRSETRKEAAHSFYDNVLPWEYVKNLKAEYV